MKWLGVGNVKVLDRHGALYYRRTSGLSWIKSELARETNPEDKKGDLAEMIKGADVFVGFSAADVLTPEMIRSMAKDPIIFALALPQPEISYELAKENGALVVATSFGHAPNQLNSSLVAPGIFRGALDVRATQINKDMLCAAACAMAALVDQNALDEGMILPQPLDMRLSARVAAAVAKSAMDTGTAQVTVEPDQIEQKVLDFVKDGSNAWVHGPNLEELKAQGKSNDEISLILHKKHHGVIETQLYVPIKDQQTYDHVYSLPEAAKPCEMLRDNPDLAYDMTLKNNLVAIVTDGSAVLGLGNIGPGAGLPVMEGKAVLFKAFGGVEAVPICLRTQEIDEIVDAVKKMSPVFGGINLEDIAAPRCFDVEARLTKELDIPVFHDDQHGTAVVVLAGLLNALKVTGKKISDLKITVNGAGASALSVSNLLMRAGAKDIVICDTTGIIYKGREKGMNRYKHQIAEVTNLSGQRGSLNDAIRGADMFLGLSAPGMVNQDMVRSMAKDPIIFALANPTPEIMPEDAFAAGACVMATGRSDFPNQVNNSLAFPGIFRGAMDVRARNISVDMKIAAAQAISSLVSDEQLGNKTIIPGAFDLRVAPAVAAAVAKVAIDTGEARRKMNPDEIAKNLSRYLDENMLSTDPHAEMALFH